MGSSLKMFRLPKSYPDVLLPASENEILSCKFTITVALSESNSVSWWPLKVDECGHVGAEALKVMSCEARVIRKLYGPAKMWCLTRVSLGWAKLVSGLFPVPRCPIRPFSTIEGHSLSGRANFELEILIGRFICLPNYEELRLTSLNVKIGLT